MRKLPENFLNAIFEVVKSGFDYNIRFGYAYITQGTSLEGFVKVGGDADLFVCRTAHGFIQVKCRETLDDEIKELETRLKICDDPWDKTRLKEFRILQGLRDAALREKDSYVVKQF